MKINTQVAVLLTMGQDAQIFFFIKKKKKKKRTQQQLLSSPQTKTKRK